MVTCTLPRHCERSEAIQGHTRGPWIASSPFGRLAMTSYAVAAALRATGFSTIGRLITAESRPNSTESHHTEL